jgi:ribosomal protein L11 methylase PrmA
VLADGASFRDPDGFVFRREGVVYRAVQQSYADDYTALMESGLYAALTRDRRLVPHDEQAPSDGAWKILRPEQIHFVSHPYEWCFSQLKDAALLTLRIQQEAIAHGMSLKDASAYNVQFQDGRPIFIDTLSFERLPENQPWVAYRQFCQHFLAPLALMTRTDVRLSQLLRIHLDGVPLDLASRLLPFSTKLQPSLALHVHAHAKSQQAHGDDAAAPTKSGSFSKRTLSTWIEGLLGTVEDLDWRPGGTEWHDYYEKNHNYGAEGLAAKEQALAELIGSPQTVWDLGANTGRFSRVAARAGARVVSWDIDPACVEANYRETVRAKETAILPLLQDLTNPSPSLGWANDERKSLASRGPVDLVMALGLIHHLAISNNVPLEQVARYFASLAPALVLEWVPKEDSQVERLLRTRKDVFPHYDRAGFERAFGTVYAIARAIEIPGTRRTLYRLERR